MSMRLQFIGRQDFIRDYWDCRPGDHVNCIGSTGGGKSHLLYSLADVTMARYPDLRFTSLMPKPRDSAVAEWGDRLGLKEIDSWPPRKHFWENEPRGHLLWPKHDINDEERNRANLAELFSKCMNSEYGRGDSITFADDAYLIGVIYGLNMLLDRHWIAGRSSGAGLWTSLQKPSGTVKGAVSSFAYDAPTHLFFTRDNDARNLKRISEIAISQLDPAEIAEVVKHLRVERIGDSNVSEMLYINRGGPHLAIVGIH